MRGVRDALIVLTGYFGTVLFGLWLASQGPPMTDPMREDPDAIREYAERTGKKLGPGDDVLTRDLSSGRIHRRIRVGDNLATIEADNLDDAGEYVVITAEELSRAEVGQLCERCFPPVPADDAE